MRIACTTPQQLRSHARGQYQAGSKRGGKNDPPSPDPARLRGIRAGGVLRPDRLRKRSAFLPGFADRALQNWGLGREWGRRLARPG